MFGAAVVATRIPEQEREMVGVEVEAAWWFGRVCLAVEGSAPWNIVEDGPRAATLGGQRHQCG